MAPSTPSGDEASNKVREPTAIRSAAVARPSGSDTATGWPMWQSCSAQEYSSGNAANFNSPLRSRFSARWICLTSSTPSMPSSSRTRNGKIVGAANSSSNSSWRENPGGTASGWSQCDERNAIGTL